MGVRKMLSVVEIKANVGYFYFLRGLLYLLRILPTTYSKYILISAKTLIGTLPFVWIGILSVLTVVMQGFIGKYLFGSKKIQKERADAHQVEVNRLQQCIEDEKDERLMLQRSSDEEHTSVILKMKRKYKLRKLIVLKPDWIS